MSLTLHEDDSARQTVVVLYEGIINTDSDLLELKYGLRSDVKEEKVKTVKDIRGLIESVGEIKDGFDNVKTSLDVSDQMANLYDLITPLGRQWDALHKHFYKLLDLSHTTHAAAAMVLMRTHDDVLFPNGGADVVFDQTTLETIKTNVEALSDEMICIIQHAYVMEREFSGLAQDIREFIKDLRPAMYKCSYAYEKDLEAAYNDAVSRLRARLLQGRNEVIWDIGLIWVACLCAGVVSASAFFFWALVIASLPPANAFYKQFKENMRLISEITKCKAAKILRKEPFEIYSEMPLAKMCSLRDIEYLCVKIDDIGGFWKQFESDSKQFSDDLRSLKRYIKWCSRKREILTREKYEESFSLLKDYMGSVAHVDGVWKTAREEHTGEVGPGISKLPGRSPSVSLNIPSMPVG